MPTPLPKAAQVVMRLLGGNAPGDFRADQNVDSRVALRSQQLTSSQAEGTRVVGDEDRAVEISTVADQDNGLSLAPVPAPWITRRPERVDENIDVDLLSLVREDSRTTSPSNLSIRALKTQRFYTLTPFPFNRFTPALPASQEPGEQINAIQDGQVDENRVVGEEERGIGHASPQVSEQLHVQVVQDLRSRRDLAGFLRINTILGGDAERPVQ